VISKYKPIRRIPKHTVITREMNSSREYNLAAAKEPMTRNEKPASLRAVRDTEFDQITLNNDQITKKRSVPPRNPHI
jgi:hypothetical protein